MGGTLTLSTVEQTSVMHHLETQYDMACRRTPQHPDCAILHQLMTRLSHDRTVGVGTFEALVALRHLRFQHRRLDDDMMALEERRLRGGHNGDLDAAHRTLDTEATILADVLRRLWDILAQ